MDREQKRPHAGLEWLLPTAAALYVTKSYFDGILKGGRKGALPSLEEGHVRAWAYLSTRRGTVVASDTGKLAPHDGYSRALSIMAPGQPCTIKLLIANSATDEELLAATDAFVRLLEYLYVGQPIALRYHGGVTIVTYDAATNSVRAADPNET